MEDTFVVWCYLPLLLNSSVSLTLSLSLSFPYFLPSLHFSLLSFPLSFFALPSLLLYTFFHSFFTPFTLHSSSPLLFHSSTLLHDCTSTSPINIISITTYSINLSHYSQTHPLISTRLYFVPEYHSRTLTSHFILAPLFRSLSLSSLLSPFLSFPFLSPFSVASATTATIRHSYFQLSTRSFPFHITHTSNHSYTLTPSTPTSSFTFLGKCTQHAAASPTQLSILSSSSSPSFSSSQPWPRHQVNNKQQLTTTTNKQQQQPQKKNLLVLFIKPRQQNSK